MLELGSSGSARGVSSNGHPYRDPPPDSEAPDRVGKVRCGAERQRRVSDRSADLCWSIRGDGLAPIADQGGLKRGRQQSTPSGHSAPEIETPETPGPYPTKSKFC